MRKRQISCLLVLYLFFFPFVRERTTTNKGKGERKYEVFSFLVPVLKNVFFFDFYLIVVWISDPQSSKNFSVIFVWLVWVILYHFIFFFITIEWSLLLYWSFDDFWGKVKKKEKIKIKKQRRRENKLIKKEERQKWKRIKKRTTEGKKTKIMKKKKQQRRERKNEDKEQDKQKRGKSITVCQGCFCAKSK